MDSKNFNTKKKIEEKKSLKAIGYTWIQNAHRVGNMWIPAKTRTARKSSFLPKIDYNFKCFRQSMKIKFNVSHSIYNLHEPGCSTMITPSHC